MNSPATTAQLDWVSLTGNFLLVIVLLVAVLWVLRRLQGVKGLQGLRPVARRLSVVEALTVGPRQKLAVVRLDDREVLVGITPSGFTLLDVAGVRPSAQSSVEGSNT
jgi:flagellar protein FliO/FliZ